jgi:hypothetical protein
MKRAFACLVTAGIALAGCGGSSAVGPLAAGDAASLRNDLSTIRAKAAAHDPAGAHASAQQMRSDVDRLVNEGRLSGADGHALLTALAEVNDRISREVHSGPATVLPGTQAPEPAPGPKAPKGPKGHEHKGGDGGD